MFRPEYTVWVTWTLNLLVSIVLQTISLIILQFDWWISIISMLVYVSWSVSGKCEDGFATCDTFYSGFQVDSNVCLLRLGKCAAGVQCHKGLGWVHTYSLYFFVFFLMLRGGETSDILCFVPSLTARWMGDAWMWGQAGDSSPTWLILLVWRRKRGMPHYPFLVCKFLFIKNLTVVLFPKLLQGCLLWWCYLGVRRDWGLNSNLALCGTARGREESELICEMCEQSWVKVVLVLGVFPFIAQTCYLSEIILARVACM